MTTTNEVIRDIISSYPNFKFTFKREKDGILITFNRKTILMKNDDKIENVKRKINDRNDESKLVCGICYEKSQMMACCCECANRVCIACHMILFIDNDGINKCSFCRSTIGSIKTKQEQNTYINKVLNNIDNREFYEVVRGKIYSHIN